MDGRWAKRLHASRDEAVVLEPTQCLGEHLLRDAGRSTAELTEPQLAAGCEEEHDHHHAAQLALDQLGLLDTLSVGAAHVVGLDAGVAPAFALATTHPARVLSLTVVEGLIGGIPGSTAVEPWWFGLHQAPGGLAEDVLDGNQERYVDFFLDIGSRTGIPAELRTTFVRAYGGRDQLRAAFEQYRAMPANAEANRAWSRHGRLAMPVAAVGASTLSDAPARQLELVSQDLRRHVLPDSGHIVPLDDPSALATIIGESVSRAGRRLA